MAALRKDAQRNRERLVEAARAVFAERGLDVALDEVARRAGVSIGTLYNRFPTRADLVAAVFADRIETVEQIAEHALAMDDPWAGFVHLVEQVSRMQSGDRGYNDLSARSLPQASPRRGRELMIRMIERARDAGALRADFELPDLAFVTWAITRTIEATTDVAPDAWRRHLGFVLDGLRAPAAHPLTTPALTEEEITRILRDC
ncbi:MAG: TetR/AcrR family transcriptional regulator [Pseudonocardia sp.]